MDGLTTYVDLVSLLIEENHDGRREAERLADKYGARVVGAIPPLNLYQLRLPARDLVQRDALVLRIGSETSVDAVVVEESAPEKGEETEAARRPVDKPDSDSDEWAANRFMDAVNYYQRRVRARQAPLETRPMRIGVIERDVDFDAPDFADYLGPCKAPAPRTCLYARDAERPDNHGSTVAGILAARWDQGGNSGFLRGLDRASQGFEVIVERNSDAGITANVAASVNLVEDGVRVLNWSWGIHRVGARDVDGDEVDSLVRSGIAMSGYEELLEEFFLWLRKEHPDVLVVNSAGNGSSYSGTDEYRLPSSFVTEQLLVVGGHQRSERQAPGGGRPGLRGQAQHLERRHAGGCHRRRLYPCLDPGAGRAGRGALRHLLCHADGRRHGRRHAFPQPAAATRGDPHAAPAQRHDHRRRLRFRAGRCRGPHRTDPALGARLPPGPPRRRPLGAAGHAESSGPGGEEPRARALRRSAGPGPHGEASSSRARRSASSLWRNGLVNTSKPLSCSGLRLA